jgi:hypothetical protein
VARNDATLVWRRHNPAANDGKHWWCEGGFNPCIVYYPTGKIDWTVDWSIPTRSCHDQGTVAAGEHTIIPSDQQLILWPDGQGGYTYSGHGFDPVVRSEVCNVDAPVEYFNVPEYENYPASADLQTIQGEYSYGPPNNRWEYAWSFSAVACRRTSGVCQ